MKRCIKVLLSAVLTLALALAPCAAQRAAATEYTYTAPADLMRIGLVDIASSFPSVNFQNVTETSSGYEFGYYDGRTYVPVGGSVGAVKISAMMDRNMVYNPSYSATNAASNPYEKGSEGSVVVGCYHVRLDAQYPDYASARAAADTFTSFNAFVRFEKGGYYVLVGTFVSSGAASSAAGGLGIAGSYTIDSGTANTVTVVETGTNKILFEFDWGTQYNLAIRPLGINGAKPRTWFRGQEYYGDFVLWRNTGVNLTVINYVNVEDYVKGVIPSEMSASWPIEALKAGAVCARTYAMANLNKHKSLGYDLCNKDDCQVYFGRRGANENSDQAVDETAGQYLTYEGKLCGTYYYSCNGGASENNENVWVGGKPLPYLRGVTDPYEAAVADKIRPYNWTVTFTGDSLAQKLQSKGFSCTTIVSFTITRLTDTGNVASIMFVDANGKQISLSGEKCKTVMGLRSMRYRVNEELPGNTVQKEVPQYYVNSDSEAITGELSQVYAIGDNGLVQLPGDSVYAITGSGAVETVSGSNGTSGGAGNVFVINGAGHGHNVGLSQWGAYSMAKIYGLTYIDILTFYYTGTEILTSYVEPEPEPDPGTDPETGETDPGTGETDPGTGETDPGTGETDPGTGETDPGTGETDPGTGETDPGMGETGIHDPGLETGSGEAAG